MCIKYNVFVEHSDVGHLNYKIFVDYLMSNLT